ncbi:MAG: HEAT repeat domain-containing protein, partial [Planctomycetes bacterium]|nr:HEAT repeat domain-containing protein [Planctomycetota bacterium]
MARQRAAGTRLIAALADEKCYVRQRAAIALGALGMPAAASALRWLSDDLRLAVRTAATPACA